MVYMTSFVRQKYDRCFGLTVVLIGCHHCTVRVNIFRVRSFGDMFGWGWTFLVVGILEYQLEML